MDESWVKKYSPVFELLIFWGLLNVISGAIAGVVFKPFGSPEKWVEHATFLIQMFVGVGLFVFTAEKYGFTLISVLISLKEEIRGAVVAAGKYFLIYICMLAIAVMTLSAVLYILSSGGDQGLASGILGVNKDIFRFNSLVVSAPGGYAFYLLGACLVSPVIEEVFYRRLLFGELRRNFGFTAAAVISACIFAVFHPNVVGSLIAGAYLAYSYEKGKSLATNIILHSLLNLLDISVIFLLFRRG